MTTGQLARMIVLGVLWLGVFRFALVAELPAKEFRVSGTVLSSRDGAPVPYCRISAYPAAASDAGAARANNGGRQRFDRRPGMQGGGRLGGFAGVGGGNLPPEVTSDASGKFSLELPHGGTWRIAASARGFPSQDFEEHEGFYSAVVLSDTAPTYSLKFRLVPDSVLTGLIVDESGDPVASAQVTAELISLPAPGESAGGRPRRVGFSQTDDRGRYEIGGLAPGQYHLVVQAQPWYAVGGRGLQGFRQTGAAATASGPSPDPSLDVIYPVTWFPGVDDEAAAEIIRIAPGEERQADFHLTAIPSIHLRIPKTEVPASVGETRGRQQVPPVMITRLGNDFMVGMQRINPGSNLGSEWDFGGLAPGTYEVRIPGPDGRTGDVRQIEVRAGAQTVLTLNGAKAVAEVEVKLEGVPTSYTLLVEFVDTETGVRVSTAPNFRGRGGRALGDQGEEEPESASWTIMLAPHSYEVSISGNTGAYLTGLTGEGAKVTGRVVTISGAATLTLHLANKHVQVEGVVRGDGGPAVAAMVLLVPATLGLAGGFVEIKREETNTDGTFQLSDVPPGKYILVAIDHGWDVDWRDPATLGQYLVRGTPVDLRTVPKAHEELQAVAPN